MKKKTLGIIAIILFVLLFVSLHYNMKNNITLECEDLGKSTIYVALDTVDVLRAIEERYELNGTDFCKAEGK